MKNIKLKDDMKWKLVAWILILSFHIGMAANNSDSTKIKYSLGFTPSAVMNIAPSIQLTHELSFSKYLSFGLETGYIFSYGVANIINTKGVRLRPKLKFTLTNNKFFNVDLYGFYNYRYFLANLSRDVVRANGAYTEEVRGTRKTTLTGYGLGVDFGFSNFDNLIKKINVGFGLGPGNINNEYSEQMFDRFTFFGFNRSGISPIPILFFHISVFIL